MFLFWPLPGEMIPTNIFQVGWNHHHKNTSVAVEVYILFFCWVGGKGEQFAIVVVLLESIEACGNS